MVKILDLPRGDVVREIRDGNVTVCVVGLGYVGLPLAVLFAMEGARIIGCVRTENSARRINQGETRVIEHDISSLLQEGAVMLESSCPNCGVRIFKLDEETFCPSCGRFVSITDYGVHIEDFVAKSYERIVESRQSLEDLLKKAIETDRFYATTRTTESVRKSDVILITVGTPISEKNAPDHRDLLTVSHAVGKGLRKDSLVILKSTVPPGTTEKLVKPILEEEADLNAGTDFGLAFMPETIKEGHALYEFRTLPRIVGGVTERCARAAANTFSIFPAPVYAYEDTAIVEAAKLFMNIYRDVNIALVNEFAMISERLGFDVIGAINAANIDPKTHLLTPGLVGGYCLPKDTYHLSHPAEKTGYLPRLITLARRLNNFVPEHVLELTDEAFEEMKIPVENARVAVLGLGFKANSGDLRNTPAKSIIEGLYGRGAHVVAQDPFVQLAEVSKVFPGLVHTKSVEEAVRGAACTVIVTDHLEYHELTADYLKELMTKPCAVVDARHIVDPREVPSDLVYRGFGKPKA